MWHDQNALNMRMKSIGYTQSYSDLNSTKINHSTYSLAFNGQMAVWYAVMDCFSWPTWLTWPLDAPSASSCGPNEIAEKSPFPEAPSRAKQCDCPADSSSKNWWNCEITCSAWWPIPKWLERLAAEIIPGQDCLDTLHGPVISDAQGLLELQGSDCPAWLATLQCRNGGCSPPTAPFKHHCKICKHWISGFFSESIYSLHHHAIPYFWSFEDICFQSHGPMESNEATPNRPSQTMT